VTEQSLIEGLRNGDDSAFRELVDTRQGLVFNTVLGLLQNQEDAEDVTQEVFIKVFESIGQFKGGAALSTWIYRIAVTRSLEHLRMKKRKKRFAYLTSLFGDDNEPLHEPKEFNHPGIQLDNREKGRILFREIAKLPENQKIAFVLHKVECLSYQEVADIMHTTVAAVESLIHRARQNLRKTLMEFYKQQH
jgi:RNA polymerase sigma-70 factor (ECF subfamily)